MIPILLLLKIMSRSVCLFVSTSTQKQRLKYSLPHFHFSVQLLSPSHNIFSFFIYLFVIGLQTRIILPLPNQNWRRPSFLSRGQCLRQPKKKNVIKPTSNILEIYKITQFLPKFSMWRFMNGRDIMIGLCEYIHLSLITYPW